METTFYDVYLGTISTAIVLLCSIILLPIERFSEKNPSVFTKHIFLDPVVVIVAVILFLTFLYNSLAKLPDIFIWNYIPLLKGVSTLLSTISLLSIIVGVVRIGILFSPAVLLNKILKKSIRFISSKKRWINSAPQDPESKIQELSEMMQDTMNYAESVNQRSAKYRVPYNLVNETLMTISIFKDCIVQYGSNKVSHGYTAALDCLCQLLKEYYAARCEYLEWRDGVTVRLIEMTTDLRKLSKDSSDILYERACIATIENFAKVSMQAKFIGCKQGHHTVGQTMLKTLIEHAQECVKTKRQDGAYESLRSAKNVAMIMSHRTYIKSVSNKLDDMVIALKLALVVQDYVVSQMAIECIFRSIFDIVGNNQPHDNYDCPLSRAEKALKEVIDLEIYNHHSLCQTPAVMWSTEIQHDISWNALVRNALFSNYVHENMLIYNIQFAEIIVKLLMNLIEKFDHIFPDHLYQVGIWLISGLSPDFALNILISNQVTIFQDQEKKGIRKIFKEIIVFFASKKQFVVSKDTLSLVSILVILEDISSDSEKELAEECIQVLCESISNYKSSFDSTQQFNAIKFEHLLRARGFTQYADTISIGQSTSYSFHDLSLFNMIRRPLFTFDSTYFNKIDELISQT